MKDIDIELKARGLLTTEELMNGPLAGGFMVDASVVDFPSFLRWLEKRTGELLDSKARLELDGDDRSELYEWVLGHYAAFGEVRENLKAALVGDGNALEITGDL